MSGFGDFLHTTSIAVVKGHFNIVKHILENTTDFDLSDTGKLPLCLSAEYGYYDILVLLLLSKYNDITKTYLSTTPLEISVWRNKTKVVQLLIQKENKLKKYLGNYHLFEIQNVLSNLKRSEFCINEQTGKEDYQTQDRNHRHLPYLLWHIITEGKNDYLISISKFKLLMEHFAYVNVGETKWISLLETTRGRYVKTEKYQWWIHIPCLSLESTSEEI